MASIEELREERIKKLNLLRDRGVDPYPSDTRMTAKVGEFLTDFPKLDGTDTKHWLVGRVMSLRKHGGSIFADIYDGTGKVQAFFKEDGLGEDVFSLFDDAIDMGDFIEVEGTAFTTKRGEPSLLVLDWAILSKSLRPLPEKWHGLQNVEERQRKRYLDILMNPELKDMFNKKAMFWKSVREYMEKENFVDVQTPTLELTTGGAEATPFKTHHNDYDVDVFMRISIGELWQKRLMASGITRTYEIGRAYRNEGSSPEHLQEFTNMEFYAAFMNFNKGKDFVKGLYQTVAKETFGTTKFSTRGHDFDLADVWEDLDYVSTVEEKTGINILEASLEDIKSKLKELGVEYDGENRERLSDSLWKYCRKQISGPAFLINHPKLVAPLSKENTEDDRLTTMFQVIIAGSELGRAHAELNDPIDQQARFDEQKKLLEAGDTEAMMPDDEYVEMLEHGMPPTFGFGFGERFFAYMVDKPIRETQLFPFMKPKQD